MGTKCPGSNRNISSELVSCPRCGKEIELFSDEMQRRCPYCRQMVFHDVVPACIQWCAQAETCMDAGSWLEYKQKNRK